MPVRQPFHGNARGRLFHSKIRGTIVQNTEKEMILNLTNRPASQDQVEAGVIDLKGKSLKKLMELLTFNKLPTKEEILERARNLAKLAAEEWYSKNKTPGTVMIGGDLWLMAPLAYYLRLQGLKPVFAFSTVEEVEEISEDRTISVVPILRHQGFVESVI